MPCIITGCENLAEHNLGIRLRRPDTTAIWAPNTDAMVCAPHAVQGLRIDILLAPTQTGEIETIVQSFGRTVNRTTPIIQAP